MTVQVNCDIERRLRNRVIKEAEVLRHQARVSYNLGSDDELDRQAADEISILRGRIENLEDSRKAKHNK